MLELVIAGGAFGIAYAVARRRGQKTRNAIIIGICAGAVAWMLYVALFVYVMMKANGA